MLANEYRHLETEGLYQDLCLHHGVSVSDAENENMFSTVGAKM
jgi:hypothetical protein